MKINAIEREILNTVLKDQIKVSKTLFKILNERFKKEKNIVWLSPSDGKNMFKVIKSLEDKGLVKRGNIGKYVYTFRVKPGFYRFRNLVLELLEIIS